MHDTLKSKGISVQYCPIFSHSLSTWLAITVASNPSQSVPTDLFKTAPTSGRDELQYVIINGFSGECIWGIMVSPTSFSPTIHRGGFSSRQSVVFSFTFPLSCSCSLSCLYFPAYEWGEIKSETLTEIKDLIELWLAFRCFRWERYLRRS